ncbi:MAG: amidohydrolase [Verrucomicrobiales bacterium]|nr:amidohydrolase [Verrucomicrobiales bacterium]
MKSVILQPIGWSPVKVFGGYGAPLDVRKAARAGVLVPEHAHGHECYAHGCTHSAFQLLAGVQAARQRFAGFWGLGCDSFAF